ncbi:hypothetical protein FRC10_008944 [Ceratobasidium sp. 414]|nr:hypothetical protein FRC10_008944 [Ceratobasidium sp. 414]
MATEFPHVHFRSLDVAPIMAHVPRPNIVFEVYNFAEGLLLDDSSQDVVFLNVVFGLVSQPTPLPQSRLVKVETQVKDYPALIREAHRVLRPGGLIHIRDFDTVLYDPENVSQPARHTNPAGCRTLDTVRNVLAQMGLDPQTFEHLSHWLASEPNGTAGFENIQDMTKMFPLYPHESAICGHKVDPRIAPYLEHFALMSFRDTTSILLDAGMEASEANSLIEETIMELRSPGNCVLMKLPCVYAVKRA